MTTVVSTSISVSEWEREEIVRRIRKGNCTKLESYAYQWLQKLISENEGSYQYESSNFGTVTMKVPYEASDAVEALMCKLGAFIVKKVNVRRRTTGEIVRVELTYKSTWLGEIT